ncbi:MAG: hypothetical protein GOVbin4296_44 [Prokaryotic dsDNA virus sp.]|nr:MAG: hypothetical protein GOVbin4296_44 [Prokaryotic dsDNA virus sp.]|tara:strand:- start:52 stop:546 length:495 start_codon:yes stop_codon:yes gene_type:complete
MRIHDDIKRLKISDPVKVVKRIPLNADGQSGDMRLLQTSKKEELYLKVRNKWFKLPVEEVRRNKEVVEVKSKMIEGIVPAAGKDVFLNKKEFPQGSVLAVFLTFRSKDTASDKDMWAIPDIRSSGSSSRSVESYYDDVKHSIYFDATGSFTRGKKFRAIIFYKQ